MKPVKHFNKYFGLHWYDRFSATYWSIFFVTALFIGIIVSIVARINFQNLRQEIEPEIRKKYVSFVSRVTLGQEEKREELESQFAVPGRDADTTRLSTAEKREQERSDITEEVRQQGIFQPGPIDEYAYLPDVESFSAASVDEIQIVELSRPSSESRNWPGGNNKSAKPGGVTNFDAGDINKPANNLFNYIVRRQGSIYIDVTDELVEGSKQKQRRGYRDPEEIERVIYNYQPMIEHCFRREAQYVSNIRGYVKVQFKISYEGHVIPESIKIVNSTVRNRKVEQCIKNFITHWRDFEELDESNGIVTVTQKFVYN